MFNLTPLGSGSQSIPETPLIGNSNIIGIGGIVIYTVPAGKKATINGFLDRVIGYGTGTTVSFSIAGQTIRTKTGAGVPELTFTNENIFKLTLSAGQTIVVSSDAAGNNASAAWFISVTELPA
jgi:hypothetical protein